MCTFISSKVTNVKTRLGNLALLSHHILQFKTVFEGHHECFELSESDSCAVNRVQNVTGENGK